MRLAELLSPDRIAIRRSQNTPDSKGAKLDKLGALHALADMLGRGTSIDAAEVERFFPGDAGRAATFAKRGSVVVGDIHPAAFAVSGAYTPVPGGVGALTIAMLMQNTVTAAKARRRADAPRGANAPRGAKA